MSVPVYRGNLLQGLVDRYRAAKAAAREAARQEAELKDEILAGMKGRQRLVVGDVELRCRKVAAVPARSITAAMVGETIGGRRGHLALELVPLDDETSG